MQMGVNSNSRGFLLSTRFGENCLDRSYRHLRIRDGVKFVRRLRLTLFPPGNRELKGLFACLRYHLMPAAPGDQQVPRPQEVFISYSRKHKEFVRRLDESFLKSRGCEACSSFGNPDDHRQH